MQKIIDNVLVTGASGLIGKVVVKELLDEGYRVTAMVRPNSIVPFTPNPNLTILRADILDYSSYSDKVKNVTVIVHLAANKYHPRLSYLVNIDGARNLAKLIEEKKLKNARLINISSQSTKIKWKGVYGKSKLESDKILQSSQARWTTIKPSLVYGEDKGSLFDTITYYTQKLPVVPVIGDGKWMLSPISTEDLAKVIVKIIKNPKTIKKTYDIGSKERISFDDLIRQIQGELQINKPIMHIPFLLGLIAAYIFTKLVPNPPISIDNVLGSNQDTHYDPEPAIKDLNIKVLSPEKGVKKYFSKVDGKKIKIALIGLGKMGTLHATILNTIPSAQVTALIDKDASLCKTAQSMGIKANYFSSFEEALEKDSFDAVYICTPTFAHKEAINTCLEKKLPFFVEKPVYNDFSNFQTVSKIKNRNILQKSVSGYFWIYKREIEYTKKLIKKNVIGKILKYNIFLRHSEVFGPKKGWLFNKSLSGGGVLMNPGPHAFSIIQYLFGDALVEQSKLESLYSTDLEDKARVLLSHTNGIKGQLNANWSVPGFPVLSIEYEIIGKKGLISFKNNKLSIRLKNKNNKTLEYYQIPSSYSVYNLNPRSGGDAYYLEDFYFIDALSRNKSLTNNLSFANKIESLIHDSYEKTK